MTNTTTITLSETGTAAWEDDGPEGDGFRAAFRAEHRAEKVEVYSADGVVLDTWDAEPVEPVEPVKYTWVLGLGEIDPSDTLGDDEVAVEEACGRFRAIAEEYCTEHEGPALSICVRESHGGRVAGIYRSGGAMDGGDQILGYTAEVPEEVERITSAAFEHAWSVLSTELQADDEIRPTVKVAHEATAAEYAAAQTVADDAGVDIERGEHTCIDVGDEIAGAALLADVRNAMAAARGEASDGRSS